MTFYCIQEAMDGSGREVVIVTSTVVDDNETEHSQGTVPIDDPDLPKWIKDPNLPLDCYDEGGKPVVPE